MKTLFSRPLTAPASISAPVSFCEIVNESDLSAEYARRFSWLGEKADVVVRLDLLVRLLRNSASGDLVVTGRYGEYLALLQSLLPLGKRTHLMLDIEWLEVHGTGLRSRCSRWLRRQMIYGADQIQVFCHAEARNYARYFGVSESHFVWIPYCTWLEPFTKSETKEFLLTSGLHQRDYPTLFRAVEGLPVELRVVGPESMFVNLQPPSNVRLLGVLSRAAYLRELAAARFVVLSLQPNLLRCPGVITYVTAMHAGKCVVVNDPVGARSYIDHGKSGFLVKAADPLVLREQICALLGDPQKVASAGEAAREAAMAHFAGPCYFPAVQQAIQDLKRSSPVEQNR